MIPRVYLSTLLATVFWGANFVLAGPILHDLPPLWAASLRFGFGTLIMLLWSFRHMRAMFAMASRHLPVYLLAGALGIGGFNLLFFTALQTTSSTNAALVMATNPLLTTLLAALLLGERPATIWLFSIPLALSGVILVITDGHPARLLQLDIVRGDWLMLGANLAWAGYNLLTRRLPRESTLINTTLLMGTGTLMLLCAAFYSGQPLTLPGWQGGLALALMVTAGTVVAYMLWNRSIAELGAARTALFLNLVPVFAMLTASLLGQLPNLIQLGGGALVIGSVMLSMWRKT